MDKCGGEWFLAGLGCRQVRLLEEWGSCWRFGWGAAGRVCTAAVDLTDYAPFEAGLPITLATWLGVWPAGGETKAATACKPKNPQCNENSAAGARCTVIVCYVLNST